MNDWAQQNNIHHFKGKAVLYNLPKIAAAVFFGVDYFLQGD